MPERRHAPRPGGADRRSFPRPPLWLNLVLLVIAAATFAFAAHQRRIVQQKTALLFQSDPNSPAELNRIRSDLAQMDLTKEQLAHELDARMAYLRSLAGEDFYITVDTTQRVLQFRLGKDVVREASVVIGPPQTVTANGGTWTFSPLKGGFSVTGKDDDYTSAVPAWVYAIRNQPVPAERPAVHDWLGRDVVFLPNGYVIHSPPPPDSPLHGPKPGSFMVPEDDLAAIWPRISTDTRVYVF
jgi:hypothetical protein